MGWNNNFLAPESGRLRHTITTALLIAKVYKGEGILPTKGYSPWGTKKTWWQMLPVYHSFVLTIPLSCTTRCFGNKGNIGKRAPMVNVPPSLKTTKNRDKQPPEALLSNSESCSHFTELGFLQMLVLPLLHCWKRMSLLGCWPRVTWPCWLSSTSKLSFQHHRENGSGKQQRNSPSAPASQALLHPSALITNSKRYRAVYSYSPLLDKRFFTVLHMQAGRLLSSVLRNKFCHNFYSGKLVET